MWKLPGTRFTSKKPETRHPGWSVFQLMACACATRREREQERASGGVSTRPRASVGSIARASHLARFGPLLVLVLEVELALDELEEVLDGAIRAVVSLVDRLVVVEEAQRREGLHLLRRAQRRVGGAVDLHHVDGLTLLLDALGEDLPHGREPLAPDAPRRIEVDERELVLLEEAVEALRVERARVLAVLVQHLELGVVVLRVDLVVPPVAALVHAAHAVRIELPLLDVRRHVHHLGADRVVQVDLEEVTCESARARYTHTP